MKHSKSTKAIALLMSMTMITSVFVGNTLSRYVTSVSSTDNARVAVWGINAGEDTVMNLFSEDYIVAGKTIAASNTNGEKIMAPGTAGEAEFSIINFEQDVAPEVAYEVKISLDDSEIHEKIKNNSSVQWKLDDGAFGTWEQLKTSILSLAGNESGRHVYEPGKFAIAFQGNQEHTIAWQWIMDNSNNVMDTEMGNLALTNDLNAVIKVSITAQQVDDLITNEYILDGADQTVNLNDIEPITIRSSADFSTFQGVEVGGQPLTRDVDYTAEEGSTVITLNESYLSNLAAGTYTIDIISTDVIATTKFNIEREYINLVEQYEKIEGKRIMLGGSIASNANSSYIRVPVIENSSYIIWFNDEKYLRADDYGSVRLEDNSKQLLDAVNLGSEYRIKIDENNLVRGALLEIPSGVSYIAVNLKFAGNDFGDVLIAKYNPSLKWFVIGDSITQHSYTVDNYVTFTSDKLSLPYKNSATGGSGYLRTGGGKSFINRLNEIPSDVELITFFGSFNDFAVEGVSIGSATDVYIEGENNTLAATMNYCYDYVLENYPNAKLVVITPTPWGGSNPASSTNNHTKYVNVMKEICQEKGITVIDLYNNVDSDFVDKYVPDDNHPNVEGQRIMADMIIPILKDVINN